MKQIGLIQRSGKDYYLCQLREGERKKALALPSLLKETQPVVGDRVTLSSQEGHEALIITEVHRRQNEIYRLLVREKKKKIIASNIDFIVIVASTSKPKFKRGLLDRYLLRSLHWEIPCLVVFNKMDEKNERTDWEFEKERLNFLKTPYFFVSAKEGHGFDFDKLSQILRGKTSIFLGQSGVGKTHLINSLSRGRYNLLTGELAKVGKGAHTTTWAELLSFDDFSIIDSPGVRTMSLEDIFLEDLPYYFQDIHPYFAQCKFNDCKHESWSKGCAFHQLSQENKSDAIILSRLESYQRLYRELKKRPDWLRKKEL